MNTLIKPLVTEKASSQNEGGKYTFLVAKNANKVEIKQAIEAKYNVTVEKVNTVIRSGKSKTRYTKSAILEGRTNSLKKAIVTLSKGENIDLYSGV